MATKTRTEPTDAEKARLAPLRGLGAAEPRQYQVAGVVLRANDNEPDSTMVRFTGHASVTGKGYEMYGGPDKGGWVEYVDHGAFKRTLGQTPDVAFLVNHEGMTLARTKAGTLTLSEDKVGLKVEAQLDTRVSIVNDLVLLMEAGNLDEMSFGFRVMKQTWLDADGEEVPWWDLTGIERHLTEVNIHKGDVSIVNYGANPFTSAALRSLDDTIRHLIEGDSLDEETARRAIAMLEPLLNDTEEIPAAPAVSPTYYSDLAALLEKRHQHTT